MPDVRYNPKHGTPEQRIANRLRNSGGVGADHVIQKGEGPTRAITNIHHSANHSLSPNHFPGQSEPNPKGVGQ